MKEGMFHLVFVLFVLTFAVSGRISSDKIPGDISSYELSETKTELHCIIPRIKVHQKKIFLESNSFALLQNRISREFCSRMATTSLISLKQYQLQILEVRPEKLFSSKLRLYHSSENQDEHHLS